MSDLGPITRAILEYVNGIVGQLTMYRLIREVSLETETRHTESWYFRRLVALALEGRIEAAVRWEGDNVAIRFRRHPTAKEAEVDRFHRKYGRKKQTASEGR